ncbi:hypothetical protein MMC22_008654 [Lobaria immixta]|nr:hypothetical protein [Lobaria immixta]
MLFFPRALGEIIVPFLSICLIAAAATSDHFTNPPDGATGLAYTRGSILEVTWETDLPRISLTLWHMKANKYQYLPAGTLDTDNVTNTNFWPWTVDFDSNFNISNETFFFGLYDPCCESTVFESTNFKIIEPSTLTSTTASPSSSSSSSSSASTVITTTSPTSLMIATTPSSNSASSTAATNSRMSQSVKTGLGVGLGIGIPLSLAVGIYLGYRFHKRRTNTTRSTDRPHAAADMPYTGEAKQSQPTRQDYSRPGMNNTTDSHPVPQEVAELRMKELHSLPIRQAS